MKLRFLFAVLVVVMGLTGASAFGATSTSTLAPTTTSTTSAPSPFVYVSLGDSYASGVGNPPYVAGPAVPLVGTRVMVLGHGDSITDGCDRSAAPHGSFANVVAAGLGLDQFTNVACSGATVGSLRTRRHGESAQMGSVSASTTLVTLSVGGDDSPSYASVIEACTSLITTRGRRRGARTWRVTRAPSSASCAAAVALKDAALRTKDLPALTATYERIVKRMAPTGRLVVAAYPIPAPGAPHRACVASRVFTLARSTWGEAVGFSSADYARLRGMVASMDSTIEQAAGAANAVYPGRVSVAQPTASTTWLDCGHSRTRPRVGLRPVRLRAGARPPGWSSTWMTPCRLLWRPGSTRTSYAACAAGAWAAEVIHVLAGHGSVVASGSLHPTLRGQRVIGDAVLASVNAGT